MNLKELRRKIDSIDQNIIKLLNQRANISLEIGKIKKESGKQVYVPDRESKIYERINKYNKGPLSNKALQAIFSETMSGCLSLEKCIKIAYLGPPATFTNLAALKKFGSQVEYLECKSITEIFKEVEKRNADIGVVPIENSIEGVVSHTLDMFINSNLQICSQIMLEISHNLLSKSKDISSIKRIYSNPQVFGQCRIWLETNLPKTELVEVTSTTKAAQLATKNATSSAIASLLAAKIYGLNVISKNIQDTLHNFTRFLVIGNLKTKPTKKDKTSIIFSAKDKVGALHDMLIPFKKNNINLTKITSRPSKRKIWEYYFFVDLEGHIRDKNVKKALSELEESCSYLKILGSYPAME